MVGIPDKLAFEPNTHFSGKSYLFLSQMHHEVTQPTESKFVHTAKTHFFALLPDRVTLAQILADRINPNSVKDKIVLIGTVSQ